MVAMQAQAPLNWLDDSDIEPFQESTNVHEGDYSCGIIVNSGEQAMCDFDSEVEIPVSGGASFAMSFWGFTSEFVRVRAKVIWNDGTVTYATTYLGPNTGAWEQFSFEAEVPAGMTSARVGLRFYDVSGFEPGEVQYIDEITFESPVGTALEVANGNFEEWAGVNPEPDNYPGSFAAEAVGLGASLSWIDATGNQLPAGYLILASDEDNIGLPVDGVPVADDSNLGDGEAALNVLQGVQAAAFSNLLPNTTYYFKIFSYSNSGVLIDYKTDGTPPAAQATTEEVSYMLFTDFNADWGGWTSISIVGDQEWRRDNTYGLEGTPCALMSGYSGGNFENEDWLISPELDFSASNNELLKFYSAKNYTGPQLELRVSTDYDGTGNPNNFTWTTLTDQVNWSSGAFTWTESGFIALSQFSGNTVYIGFQFFSTTENSSNWELDNIEVTQEVLVGEPTNYPTNFMAEAIAQSITLSWDDAIGEVLPAAYLILASNEDNISAPVDGTPVANDTELADGSAAINLAYGTPAYTFEGLEGNTSYYFKIFSYTNSGILINYKTDGTVPTATATTEVNEYQSRLYTTFDESWEDWTAVSVVGDQVWDRDNTFGIEATPCAKMTGYDSGLGQAFANEDWLISPEIDLGASWIEEQLIFHSASAYEGIPLEVKISTDYSGGDPSSANWTDLSAQATWPEEGSFFVWTNSGEIDIAPYGQGNVHIAFVFYSTDLGSSTWEIDNVTVQAKPYVGIDDNLSKQTLQIYPNPGKGILNIYGEAQLETIEVYNVNGAMVYQQHIVESGARIDVSHLPKGVYVVRGFELDTGRISNNRIIIQ